MHDHAIVRNVIDRANRMGITPADTILMYLPLFHLFGFSEGVLMSMMSGARQVLTESFDARGEPDLARAGSEPPSFTASTRTSRNCWRPRPGRPRDMSSVRTGILRHRHVELGANRAPRPVRSSGPCSPATA